MPAFIDLTGQKFGRLTVLRRGPDTVYRHPQWHCICECGTERLVKGQGLRNGGTTSCGCYSRERAREVCIARNTTHGQCRRGHRTRTYGIWALLGHRHGYKVAPTVCDRWRESFEAFLADMGEPPTPKHTLDRIDNAKGYEPGNCRWATMKEQQNNRTNNRRITHDGETRTLMQWAERTGIARETIARRLDLLHWPVEKALTLPASPLPLSRR